MNDQDTELSEIVDSVLALSVDIVGRNLARLEEDISLQMGQSAGPRAFSLAQALGEVIEARLAMATLRDRLVRVTVAARAIDRT